MFKPRTKDPGRPCPMTLHSAIWLVYLCDISAGHKKITIPWTVRSHNTTTGPKADQRDTSSSRRSYYRSRLTQESMMLYATYYLEIGI